jgi:hypothetical protein
MCKQIELFKNRIAESVLSPDLPQLLGLMFFSGKWSGPTIITVFGSVKVIRRL